MNDPFSNLGTDDPGGHGAPGTLEGNPDSQPQGGVGHPEGEPASDDMGVSPDGASWQSRYEELQKKFNERDKAISEAKAVHEELATLKKFKQSWDTLKEDKRLQEFFKKTYNVVIGNPSDTANTHSSTNDNVDPTDGQDDGSDKFVYSEDHVMKIAEQTARRIVQDALSQYNPHFQFVEKNLLDDAFNKAKISGYKDIDKYRPQIEKWYDDHPQKDPANVRDFISVYKEIAFDDLMKRSQQVDTQEMTEDLRNNASSEYNRMPPASTQPKIDSFLDAWEAATLQARKRRSPNDQ